MKKLFLSMTLLATLLATSCSSDETVKPEKSVLTTFSTDTPSTPMPELQDEPTPIVSVPVVETPKSEADWIKILLYRRCRLNQTRMSDFASDTYLGVDKNGNWYEYTKMCFLDEDTGEWFITCIGKKTTKRC